MAEKITEDFLAALFPPERTDAFFDALFGEAEEGAYDIALVPRSQSETAVELAFELRQRPGKCLVCSLTYGLPGVFKRHPVIAAQSLADAVAKRLGWDACTWDLGTTREESRSLHWIPFRISRRRAS